MKATRHAAPSVAPFSETRRQVVHIGLGAFALLLRTLPWWQVAALAGAALLFNVFLLPRVAGRWLYRSHDLAHGYPAGILLYPLSILLLLLILPHRPDIVAAAWGILAAGDGMATLVGRRATRRLPWNRDKTAAGTLAFFVCGSAAGIALAWWTRPAVEVPPPLGFVLVAPILAAAAAAAIETMPVRLDDNLSVPFAAAAVLWSVGLVRLDAWLLAWPAVTGALLPAIVANVMVAGGSLAIGAISRSGALGGALVGVIVYACAGAAAWLVLLAAFLVALASVYIGVKRKALLGIARPGGEAPSGASAFARCGVAMAAAILAVSSPHRDAALLALVTALAAGGSHLVATEIGKGWGRRPFLLLSLTRVQPGTAGGVSLEGTAAGLVTALALATLARAGGLIGPLDVWLAVAGAMTGSMVESALGEALEPRGILNHHALGFLGTVAAAVAALALVQIVAAS